MNLIRRLLSRLLAWVAPRPRLILTVAFLTALASLTLSTFWLDVNTDQLELISSDHPLIAINKRHDPFNFGGKAAFTVVIETPTPERGIGFLRSLIERVDKDPEHFHGTYYRIDPESLKRWALLYLDVKDLTVMRDRLHENSELLDRLAKSPDLEGFLTGVNREMASRMVGELFTAFLDDDSTKEDGSGPAGQPMDLGVLIHTLEQVKNSISSPPADETAGPAYRSPLRSLFGTGNFDLSQEGYFWEADKRLLLAFVLPNKIGNGIERTLEPLDRLRRLITEVRKDFPDVNAGVTGEDALNNDEMETASNDMSVATWLSFGGVLAVMVLFFRGVRRPTIELVSLGTGLAWTFGWTTLFIGHLNILSVVFAPLLCGLGVDYGIHWFSRYEEEEAKNSADRLTLVRRVVERLGPGIVLAGLGASLSFLPYVLTGFRGLMELGLITGMGVLLGLVADMVVFPSLVLVFGGSGGRQVARVRARRRNILDLSRRRWVVVLAVCAVLCVVSIHYARNVRFDLNPLNLQARTAESVVWEKKLVEGDKGALLSAGIIANSLDDLQSKVMALKALPHVSDAESILTFLPGHQQDKIPLVREIGNMVPPLRKEGTAGPPDRDAIVDTLQRIRFKMQDEEAAKWGADRPLVEQMTRVRDLTEEISRSLREGSAVPPGLVSCNSAFSRDLADLWSFLSAARDVTPLQISDLPSDLRDRFVHDGEYFIRVYPKDSVWKEDSLKSFVEDVRSVDPEAGGDPVSLFVFANAFRSACISASIYAVLFILVLLIVTLRDVWLTVIAFLPLAVGSLWTFGIMGAANIDLNLANSMFLPIVVGAGLEYGIIILNRWKEGTMTPGTLPFSVGKGVVLAALTTTLGFGTLMVSNHRGIFSLGFISCAGSLCVLIAALFITTAILAFLKPPAPAGTKES